MYCIKYNSRLTQVSLSPLQKKKENPGPNEMFEITRQIALIHCSSSCNLLIPPSSAIGIKKCFVV